MASRVILFEAKLINCFDFLEKFKYLKKSKSRLQSTLDGNDASGNTNEIDCWFTSSRTIDVVEFTENRENSFSAASSVSHTFGAQASRRNTKRAGSCSTIATASETMREWELMEAEI